MWRGVSFRKESLPCSAKACTISPTTVLRMCAIRISPSVGGIDIVAAGTAAGAGVAAGTATPEICGAGKADAGGDGTGKADVGGVGTAIEAAAAPGVEPAAAGREVVGAQAVLIETRQTAEESEPENLSRLADERLGPPLACHKQNQDSW